MEFISFIERLITFAGALFGVLMARSGRKATACGQA